METNGAIFRVGNFFNDGTGGEANECPYIRIWGTVVARTLVYGNSQCTHMADIEIHNGADVTLTGTTWWEKPYSKLINPFANVTVDSGSKITVTNPEFNWTPALEYIVYVNYNVTGGTVNTKLPDEILKYGYEAVYDAETELYTIKYVACTLEDSNGEHTFKIQEPFMDLSATCETSGFHYYRCMCGSNYVDEVEALGHSYTAITIEKIATASENGVKRVTCEICADSYTYEYSFNPSEQTITIVVKTESGTKEITALVSDLYNVTVEETIDGFSASFNGVKTITDPDDSTITYTIADVVKLVIPAGFTSIATGSIKNATALTEIVLLDGANATFATKSIDGCTALAKITLGDCSATFSGNTINGTTADLTIDATKANVTTLTSAFEGKSTLKHFVMGSYKSYNFAASTFKTAGIEEFVVPDYATLTAAYATCFQANSLKYVYIGRGITHIDNIFDQCFYMQKIVLMDVTNITGQYFACLANKGEDVLRIYHHASTLSVGSNFLYQDYGVILYTNATGWTSNPVSCGSSTVTKTVNGVEVTYPAYTIVKGIPHEYKEGGTSATCTSMGSTGYTTDCPCGTVADATYTTYKGVNAGTAVNGTTAIESSIVVGTTTPALGHEFDEADGATIVSQTSATCIKDATITYKCARCDETSTVVQEGTATGHTPEAEWTVTVEATCAADGFKQKTCTVCKTIAEGEIIPAIGHEASGEWVTTVDATCTVGATRVQYCKNDCGMVALSETTEPNGHTPTNIWTTTINPTCVKAGEKEHRCSVCRAIIETVAIDALGHEFDIADGASVISIAYGDGFDKAGVVNTKCARCDEEQQGAVEAIFEALGYSVGPDGCSLKAGFMVNAEALNAYKALHPSFTFGMVMVNANSVAANASFFVDGDLNGTAKGLKVDVESLKYVSWNADIAGFDASVADSLELVVGIYTNDGEGNVSVIQYVDAEKYATTKTYADMSLNAITFNQVRVGHGMEALVPQSTLALTGDEE